MDIACACATLLRVPDERGEEFRSVAAPREEEEEAAADVDVRRRRGPRGEEDCGVDDVGELRPSGGR